MHKRSLSSTLIVAAIVVTTVGCKKHEASQPPEEDLRISIDAASYTLTTSPYFNFNVKVESALPSPGVTIDYKVVAEIDNQNYPQGPLITSYTKITTVNLTGLPRQKMCVCTVTVTSRGRSNNVATTSFRVGYK